ncbi:HK97-gp10 family putative phage morphogenesis protein [Bacillus sp. B-jedd]|uniref:HK97-gp10 family putative phage morphogenesis protein n=1 Tax=Bacillus sp. B-jedd TaxID=1476857 RepID=UPI0005155556|nr:HK97-gp10 family putative phage morphogenesis protein [Bacillus sp. B-jedd]CEG28081.1 HK97 gp10 family phage protein [Bacillus sp. B-jedd]
MQVDISGLEDLLRNMAQLNVDESIENKALTKAGKVVQEAVQEEAPVGRGEHKSSLKSQIKLKRPKNGEAHVHTGRAYHGHLVEFGRSGGSTVMRNGRIVKWGPTAPNPFFSRGYEKSKDEAQQAMADELKKGLGL